LIKTWTVRALPILAAALLLAACKTTTPSSTAFSASTGSAASYAASGQDDGELRQVSELPAPGGTGEGAEVPIAPADTLEIFVYQVPDLTRTVQVDAGGHINLPLIGNRSVAGKSVRVVEQEITQAYGANYLQDPQITVTVKDSPARRVTIDGEINRAGIYPLPPTASLLDVIALGGGFNRVGDPAKVYVFREISGQKFVAQYDVAAIRPGAHRNPRIFGGDLIVVFSSSSRIAFQNLKEALGLASSASGASVFF
jgi:polysaccharide export outer membrane protein